MTTDLDFDKLRAVAKAAEAPLDFKQLRWWKSREVFGITFTPFMVLQLLDLAQSWYSAVEKGRALQDEARQALAQRPPASELSKQWRELAERPHDYMNAAQGWKFIEEIADLVVARADNAKLRELLATAHCAIVELGDWVSCDMDCRNQRPDFVPFGHWEDCVVHQRDELCANALAAIDAALKTS